MQNLAYWPKMANKISKYLKGCKICKAHCWQLTPPSLPSQKLPKNLSNSALWMLWVPCPALKAVSWQTLHCNQFLTTSPNSPLSGMSRPILHWLIINSSELGLLDVLAALNSSSPTEAKNSLGANAVPTVYATELIALSPRPITQKQTDALNNSKNPSYHSWQNLHYENPETFTSYSPWLSCFSAVTLIKCSDSPTLR